MRERKRAKNQHALGSRGQRGRGAGARWGSNSRGTGRMQGATRLRIRIISAGGKVPRARGKDRALKRSGKHVGGTVSVTEMELNLLITHNVLECFYILFF